MTFLEMFFSLNKWRSESTVVCVQMWTRACVFVCVCVYFCLFVCLGCESEISKEVLVREILQNSVDSLQQTVSVTQVPPPVREMVSNQHFNVKRKT